MFDRVRTSANSAGWDGDGDSQTHKAADGATIPTIVLVPPTSIARNV